MNSPAEKRAYFPLVWVLIISAIVADQLSKAWFVYKLGYHNFNSFLAFCGKYFTLFANGVKGAEVVTQEFARDGLNHAFKPEIWVWEPWISWKLTTNTGAAWSIFHGNSFALSFVSIGMSIVLFIIWYRGFRYNHAMSWAFGAIIGGALGNFFDRFRLREVVDFINVKIPLLGKIFPKLGDPYDFPIFNIADSCAVCGTLALAGYLITIDIRGWLISRRDARAKAKAAGFKPLDEGLRLDDEAKARLTAAAEQGGALEGTDLTRFVGDGEQVSQEH